MDDSVAPTTGSGRSKGLGDLKALQPTLMGKEYIFLCCTARYEVNQTGLSNEP